MSESLKQKAKTLPEWHVEVRKKGETDCGCCSSIGTKDACCDCAVILSWHPKFIEVSVAQQEIDDCRTEATKELLNLAIHGLKEAQNGESSDCVSTFATIIEKLGIHVEYDEWHEPIIDVEQVKTVLEGNEKEKAKP